MSNAENLVTKLRDTSDGAPTAQLVSLWLDFVLDQPVAKLLPPERAVAIAADAFLAWANTPSAEEALLEVLNEWTGAAAQSRQTLGELLPEQLQEGAHKMVGRSFSPDRALVLSVIDREPVRQLLRALLVDALLEFGKQMRTPVAGVARGLTGFAKMAAETAKSATGSLGAFAGGVVGAVSGEVERQFEKRAGEFVDSALSNVMSKLADALTDPRRAPQQAALRRELLDGVLSLTPAQLSRELERADVPGGLAIARGALARFVESDGARERLVQALQTLTASRAQATARELLEELGLLETFLRYGKELGRAQLADFFATDAFAEWCRSL